MTSLSTRVGLAIGALAVVGAAGCGQRIVRPGGARPVSLAEFSQPPSPPVPEAAGTPRAGAGPAAPRGPGGIDGPFPLADDFGARTALQPTRPGDAVIVDSLVGHVNGRPIFADEFLQPIEDRLLREAERTSGLEREYAFRAVINEWLRDVVLNELIIAEAEASLSAQEQRGLFAWLRMLYEEEVRKGGGTRSGAESRRLKEGEELEQYIDRQRDLVLIDQLRGQKIEPRVVVTWRDVEREYERRYDEFNPPARVTLARIRVPTSNAELIGEVTGRLEDGEPFGEVAEALGFPDGGVWETFRVGPGGISDILVPEAMKPALEGLETGETSPPIELGSGTVWLHVVSLERPESRSIYDSQVQRLLKNSIRARRSNIEWQRYINSLLQSGVHDDLDLMADRLLRIALDRYAR